MAKSSQGCLSQLLTFHLTGAVIEIVQPKRTVKKTTYKPSALADLTFSFKHERLLSQTSNWATTKTPAQHKVSMMMLIYSGVKQLVFHPTYMPIVK
jgi:hypothetical protein